MADVTTPQTSADFRALAGQFRALALAGGGSIQTTYNGKTVRRESVKDLLAAASECDAIAARMDAAQRGSRLYSPTRLVYRGR